MVDAFGAVGPRYWRGIQARRRTEQWIRQVIRNIRAGKADDTRTRVIALLRGTSGALLDEQVAAVEFINLLRPTLAVSYLVVFCALA